MEAMGDDAARAEGHETRVHTEHVAEGLHEQVASGNSLVTVAVPVAPGVASDGKVELKGAKRYKWESSQGVAVGLKVPGSRSPQRADPKDLEPPATPGIRNSLRIRKKSPPWDSQLTQNSQREGLSPGLSVDDFV